MRARVRKLKLNCHGSIKSNINIEKSLWAETGNLYFLDIFFPIAEKKKPVKCISALAIGIGRYRPDVVVGGGGFGRA